MAADELDRVKGNAQAARLLRVFNNLLNKT